MPKREREIHEQRLYLLKLLDSAKKDYAVVYFDREYHQIKLPKG